MGVIKVMTLISDENNKTSIVFVGMEASDTLVFFCMNITMNGKYSVCTPQSSYEIFYSKSYDLFIFHECPGSMDINNLILTVDLCIVGGRNWVCYHKDDHL